MTKRNYDTIDIMKLVLSLMVVAIHISPFGSLHGYIVPLCRIAVPLFFITSGYFLFGKTQNKSSGEQIEIIQKFVSRNLKLYGQWFLILLPINYREYGYLGMGALKLIQAFFFGGLFPASWYIMALIIGALIVFCLTDIFHVNMVWVLAVGAVLYFLCCLNSNYGGLFWGITPFRQINEYYPARIVNSFPVSIIWISIGKMFAIYDKFTIKIKYVKTLCFTFFLLLFSEWAIVNKLHITRADDCYFMLIQLCITIFYLVINMNIKCKSTLLRIMLSGFTGRIYCFL